MIEIPVVKPPDVLTDLLAEFTPTFYRRQFRQFSRYISSSWVSPTRSVAHLNGIFMEHTNQSNLNRFLRNIPVLGDIQEVCQPDQPLFIGSCTGH